MVLRLSCRILPLLCKVLFLYSLWRLCSSVGLHVLYVSNSGVYAFRSVLKAFPLLFSGVLTLFNKVLFEVIIYK